MNTTRTPRVDFNTLSDEGLAIEDRRLESQKAGLLREIAECEIDKGIAEEMILAIKHNQLEEITRLKALLKNWDRATRPTISNLTVRATALADRIVNLGESVTSCDRKLEVIMIIHAKRNAAVAPFTERRQPKGGKKGNKGKKGTRNHGCDPDLEKKRAAAIAATYAPQIEQITQKARGK